MPHAKRAHHAAPPPLPVPQPRHVHHHRRHTEPRHAQPLLECGEARPPPRGGVADAVRREEDAVGKVREEPLGREKQRRGGRRGVAGHAERGGGDGAPRVHLAQVDDLVEAMVWLDRDEPLARRRDIALLLLARPSAVLHPLGCLLRPLVFLEACLVELDAGRKRGGAVERRGDDVVQVGLLVGIRKMRRRRPARGGELLDGLWPIREPVDAPVELLEHPRRAVAGRHILHV
mmetsp:Transcript_38090/g.113813  ORF Transcript_38090/g.113813 Transcript_38090/m.113813 type:complete len:232 (-) Transcript_38090:452-1147(-)